MARHPRIDFVNVAGTAGGSQGGAFSLAGFVNSQFEPAVTWKDLEWLRSIWPGPLAVKGIMSAEDALRAGG
jgi:L-lactate dehydrogenase (cytochrome)